MYYFEPFPTVMNAITIILKMLDNSMDILDNIAVTLCITNEKHHGEPPATLRCICEHILKNEALKCVIQLRPLAQKGQYSRFDNQNVV